MKGSYLWVVEENTTGKWDGWACVAGWTFPTRQGAREAMKRLRDLYNLKARVMRYVRSYQ